MVEFTTKKSSIHVIGCVPFHTVRVEVRKVKVMIIKQYENIKRTEHRAPNNQQDLRLNTFQLSKEN